MEGFGGTCVAVGLSLSGGRAGIAAVPPHSRVGRVWVAVFQLCWGSGSPTPGILLCLHPPSPACPGPAIDSAMWLWAAKNT